MISVQDTLMRKAPTTVKFSTSIDSNRRAKIKSEAKPLLKANIKCREIWQALQIADYKKEGVLNEPALEVLLEKQGKNMHDLLAVKSTEEILDLLDEEELGFLNEDEQILIFSVIKERMQKTAYDLCSIYEYDLYKEMMKGIRALENDIIEYQAVLRARTYEKEMEIYRQIGVEKFEAFEKHWNNVFGSFKKSYKEKKIKMQEQHQKELEDLSQDLQKNTDILRIKPKPQMRELQIQEKLFAFNERYAEAHQIRNELKVIEVVEQERVENKILEEKEKRRKKLLKKQELELQQLKSNKKNSKNKLLIKYEQEKVRLQKEIKLHNHDIKRNQNLASRLAIMIGRTRDELRRTKQNARDLQSFLKDSRRNKTARITTTDIPSGNSTLGRKPALKASQSMASTTIGNKIVNINTQTLTRFGIKSDATGTDRPVNITPGYMNSTSFSAKTGKLLQQSRKEKSSLPSLASLYNDKLEPKDI